MMDNGLVSLLISEDDGAWESFYRENERGIAAYFFKRGIPDQHILDLTQETFIGAFQSISSLRKPESLTSWLYGIARHIFIHYLQKKYRQIKPLEPLAPLSDPSLMEKLSLREIEVIKYRLVEGISFIEISKILGTADSTVRVTFMRAKNKLRYIE